MKPEDNAPEEAQDDNQLRTVNGGTNYMISADNFEKVISKLPADQSEILRWWFFYGKENELSLTALGKACGFDSGTLSKVFNGKYGASLDKLCQKLSKARETLDDRVDNPDFIPTSLSRQMFAAFDRCRALVNVTIMWGVMGIGKTTIAEEYRRQNNHGRTIYYRCGAGLTFSQFVSHLAMSIGVTTKNRGQFEVRHKIISLMKAGQRLLIVDELHQLFITSRGDSAVRICEFLREIHDVAKCGLVLIGTKVMQEQFKKGPNKEALEQLVDRGTIQIPLPSKPTDGDLRAFLKHYRLPTPGAAHGEAAQIMADILKASGLRKLTLHLRDGLLAANKAGEKYEWRHFVQAHEDIASLSIISSDD